MACNNILQLIFWCFDQITYYFIWYSHNHNISIKQIQHPYVCFFLEACLPIFARIILSKWLQHALRNVVFIPGFAIMQYSVWFYIMGGEVMPHPTRQIFSWMHRKSSRKPIDKFCDLYYLEKLCLQDKNCVKVSVGGQDVPLPLVLSARILVLTPEMDSLTNKNY